MPFASVTDHVNIVTAELSPVSPGAGVLLTVHDVAEFLRVPPSWVYERTRRRGRDRLPHVKVGKYLRFRLSDLETYLETLRRG
jgi:excisionase family DNA binding protein